MALPWSRSRRVVAALFALVAYASFLAAMAWAVAFVGDFLVPRTIDSGGTLGVTYALAVDVVLLALFAIRTA